MIPFPGESVGIDDTFGVLYDSIRNRGALGGAAPTATLSSGSAWRVWVYDGSQTYLEEPAADVVVSWVVEVVSGSGTVVASMGLDPMYGDTSAAHPTDLGTHTVTTGTLVLPTTLTAADVMSGGAAMMLHLACTSGSVEVQQVKLRVWPAVGVAGGWGAPQPGFTTPDAAPTRYFAQVAPDGVASNPDADTAWAAAVTTLQGSTAGEGPHDFSASFGAEARGAQGTISYADGVNRDATARVLGEIRVAQGPNPANQYPIASGLVEGVDYIRPPEEVRFDNAYLVQASGTPFVEWVNNVATLTVGSSAAAWGGPTVHATSTDTLTITFSGGVYVIDVDLITGSPITTHPAPGDPNTTATAPLPDTGRYMVVSLSHSFKVDGGTWPGPYPAFLGDSVENTANYTVDMDALAAHVRMPPYRVWSPVAVNRSPHLIFWRHDNLGAGGNLVFQPNTRQSTGLVFGNN